MGGGAHRRSASIWGRAGIPVLLLLLSAAGALAHGVGSAIGRADAVTVTFRHEDGSPLAGVPCEVLPPDGGPAFQTGRTDRLGRVVFVPDQDGRWTVRVTGQDGHGAVVPVVVDAAALGTGSAAAPPPAGRGWKLLSGVGVLLGVFGIVSLTLQRRK